MTEAGQQARPLRLECPVRHYDWGERGPDAYIPNLIGLTPEADVPYAELWIGAHPKAPSRIRETGEPLDEAIRRNPAAMLGKRVDERFGGALPFLLKVVAAGEPLSIQAHPDKAQAEKLHRRDPEHYPDDNPKPEIAVALEGLNALAGFRTPDEIERSFLRHPELAALLYGVLEAEPSRSSSWMERLVRINADPERLRELLDSIDGRIKRGTDKDESEKLFLDLRNRYPGPDIGLVFVFLLERIRLKPGEGIFIDPGMPHAYLSGRIVECMANSDNVVRAGLTPKFKDLETLAEILRPLPAPRIFRPAGEETVYPECEAFRLRRIRFETGRTIEMNKPDTPSVLLAVEGESLLGWSGGEDRIKRGDSLFMPAELGRFTLKAVAGSEIYAVDVPE